MTLEPLLSASPTIQLHAFAAMTAFALGVVQLSRRKGDGPHRMTGYMWVGLMLVIAGSSFWIHGINQWHGFSRHPRAVDLGAHIHADRGDDGATRQYQRPQAEHDRPVRAAR